LANERKLDENNVIQEAKGRAFLEVPRGVLSHFVNIEDQKIKNYQVIAPTTWNTLPMYCVCGTYCGYKRERTWKL